jgi:hypothetical protein
VKKHVSLAQQNGFGLAILHSLLRLIKKGTALWHTKKEPNQIWTLGLGQICPKKYYNFEPRSQE